MNLTSSSTMDLKEKHYEAVVDQIIDIYQFDRQNFDNLVQFRELIRNVILMYNKSLDLDKLDYPEQ